MNAKPSPTTEISLKSGSRPKSKRLWVLSRISQFSPWDHQLMLQIIRGSQHLTTFQYRSSRNNEQQQLFRPVRTTIRMTSLASQMIRRPYLARFAAPQLRQRAERWGHRLSEYLSGDHLSSSRTSLLRSRSSRGSKIASFRIATCSHHKRSRLAFWMWWKLHSQTTNRLKRCLCTLITWVASYPKDITVLLLRHQSSTCFRSIQCRFMILTETLEYILNSP